MIRENLLDYKHNHSRLQGEHEVFENDTKAAIGEAVVAGLDSTCVGWMGEESKTTMGRTESVLVGGRRNGFVGNNILVENNITTSEDFIGFNII